MEATVNGFFCGCGGLDLGFIEAGFKVTGAWDFDKFAVQSYKENVGDYVKQMDIKEMKWQDVPKASVWVYGFPCQDLSVAGRQAGIKVTCNNCGEEFDKTAEVESCPNCNSTSYKAANRSGLFYEVMRLLEETETSAPENLPAIIMAENVKGLKPYIPVLEEEYKKRGYTAHITIFNSKYWGVPQNRERYFVVGTRDDLNLNFEFPIQQTDFVPKLSTVLDKDVDEKYYIKEEKAKAVIAQALKKLEKLGTVHATITPDRAEKRQNGRRAKGEEEEMFTLTAQDLHGVIEPHLKMVGMLDMKGNETIRRVYDVEGIAPTTTTTCEGGQRQVKILEPTFIVPEATKQGYAVASVGDSININFINSETRRGRVGKGVAQTLMTGCEQVTMDPVTYRVRKLTPTEYGRLQGFPMDTWKQVVSDRQAYKQFGNAVSVPVAKAIATKIREAILGG